MGRWHGYFDAWEQQEQLLRFLAGKSPIEHYWFLGNWLYLHVLIQVHRTVLALFYTPPFPPLLLCTQGCPHRACV